MVLHVITLCIINLQNAISYQLTETAAKIDLLTKTVVDFDLVVSIDF